MVGLAVLSGLRRVELFALRWRDIDEGARTLTVREAVYDGTFSTPKTEAACDRSHCPKRHWDSSVSGGDESAGLNPNGLVFATRTGNSISPNNVLRRLIFPACKALDLPNATWLTFRRTYSSWSHEKGVPGKVVAQLMGHTNVDTTLNVYSRCSTGRYGLPPTRSAANCSRLFTDRRTRSRHLAEFAQEKWCAQHESNMLTTRNARRGLTWIQGGRDQSNEVGMVRPA